MSFNFVTTVWIAKIFIIYTLMVVVLPYFVMRKFLQGRSITQKFVFSIVAGNFFYIMIVLLWGLVHITNRYVLIATTFAIPVGMAVKGRKKLWEGHVRQTWIHLRRFIKRENSFRYSMRIFFRWLGREIKSALRRLGIFLRKNIFELILFLGCSAFVMWYFSITNHFGPRASDLVVHMYWINGVDDGILYRAGIYPFGMHALLYYFHAVFDIPTVRLVLLFGTVQAFYIFTMFLAFLKEICRYRYTPYLTYVAFAVGSYLVSGRYARYYATLPQEFGMVFILPCVIALIRFFRAVRDENAEYKRMKEQKLLYTRIDGKRRWRESTIQLWLLIISFGLTLSAHFYSTIIAGVLVLAAAVAYIRFIFNPKTFRRLVCAAVIAIMIPVFPMAVAFAGGTPLEGSLYWALEVMGVSRSDETEQSEDASSENTSEENGNTAVDSSGENTKVSAQGDNSGETASSEPAQPELSLQEKISQFVENAKSTAVAMLTMLIFSSEGVLQAWVWCVPVLLVEIPLMWLLREWEYSRYIIMILLASIFLIILCIPDTFGLPSLLDQSRASIYCAYFILTGLSLAADGVLVVLGRIIRVRALWQFASLAMAAAFVFYTAEGGYIRVKTVNSSSLERDGAQLCVYDIMEKYPDEKWTIVSCNEERNMVSPVAWHYEVCDFLEEMENYSDDDEMYIPTQYVFFFIEKRSMDYSYGEFTDVDAEVSEYWASQELPPTSGLSQYSGTNRIITNSRLYYWAQEYQKRFPNEMKVYYEDDDFVCYYIEQNEYYLNNFAIDYGYNSRDYTASEVETYD
ncbi:hypothetical protein LKD70_13005 [Ruminococcus sp. CLA-AA-H200]|uniref:Amino acid ABC transporter permease n=1 Tax=Ruminococcus turbiniformis TaxID=2881258 RepID=A0ABS8G0C6_9FIRM|nr:hypothetical protein [Ruminococcus turbiniformis]MCC2255324.1 hypothetical protein [Ruminococcus turbiniformis]